MQKQINVLLCDDHELIISGLKQILRSLPLVHNIALANNGKQALELLADQKFDLVISDVSMPEMGGIELSAFIKNNYPTANIVESKILMIS